MRNCQDGGSLAPNPRWEGSRGSLENGIVDERQVVREQAGS